MRSRTSGGTRILRDPPGRRPGCLVLITDEDDRVLLVDPDHKDGLFLPGGSADPDEPPHGAAARRLRVETGLDRPVTRRQAARVAVPPVRGSGPRGHRRVGPGDLHAVLRPDRNRRVRAALGTRLSSRASPILVNGRPASRRPDTSTEHGCCAPGTAG
ncbi:NUDIX hydrolase [Kitasatospora sp. NPDC088351]|uniref:NUDIX hydrolase n=1 Tax=Kitasatospora sp. NPDC088351 TaxID=3155180 RepID=UPI003413A9A8